MMTEEPIKRILEIKTDDRFMTAIQYGINGILSGQPFENVFHQLALNQELAPFDVEADRMAAVLFSIIRRYSHYDRVFYDAVIHHLLWMISTGNLDIKHGAPK